MKIERNSFTVEDRFVHNVAEKPALAGSDFGLWHNEVEEASMIYHVKLARDAQHHDWRSRLFFAATFTWVSGATQGSAQATQRRRPTEFRVLDRLADPIREDAPG